MFSLYSLFTRKRRTPVAAPSGRTQKRFRPLLECLEDRTLLNARFVVPIAFADNVTNFTTLQSALTTAGLVAGDTITIQSGSNPGNISATSPSVATLTIQGDPSIGLLSIPLFTFSSAFTVAGSLTLRNVNVGLVGSGALMFSGNSSIIDSSVVDSSNAPAGITLNGTTDILKGSRFLASNAAITALVRVTPPVGGTSNRIDGNTFEVDAISNVGNAGDVIAYDASAGATTVTDVVSNNKFIGAPGTGASKYNDIHVVLPSAVADTLIGLTIRNNQITNYDINHTVLGVLLDGPTQNATVSQNSIFLSGPSSIGIDVHGASTSSTTVVSAVISGNVLDAPSGFGLLIFSAFGAGVGLNVKVEGNDFHSSRTGVLIANSNGSVTGVDLGGGTQGSRGGNNFRSFTAPGIVNTAAIDVRTTAGQGTIQAQRNLFASGVTPASVVSDPNGSLNLASPLTGNAAFVASLYDNLLGRAGDTTNSADAGGFIAALNNGTATQAAVRNAILHSAEALGIQVNDLYLTLLGRAADAGGKASFVNFMQNGGTLEAVVVALVTSNEYQGQYGSNGAYVQSLYSKLLGRVAVAAEVAGFANALYNGSLSRAGVAGIFLGSQEFRGDVIQKMYSGSGTAAANLSTVVFQFPVLLKRAAPASAGEVNGWVNSGLDLLAVENALLGSNEYFTKG